MIGRGYECWGRVPVEGAGVMGRGYEYCGMGLRVLGRVPVEGGGCDEEGIRLLGRWRGAGKGPRMLEERAGCWEG